MSGLINQILENQRFDQLMRRLDNLEKGFGRLDEKLSGLTVQSQSHEKKQRFDRLAAKWKNETGHLSNTLQRCMNSLVSGDCRHG